MLLSKNPIKKLCPRCGCVCIVRKIRNYRRIVNMITGRKQDIARKIQYECLRCRAKFNKPIIVNLSSSEPSGCDITNDLIKFKVYRLKKAYNKLQKYE